LEPKAVTEVGISYEGRTTKLYSQENTVDIHPLSLDFDGYLFFDVEEDGPVKLSFRKEPIPLPERVQVGLRLD
jgi:hypothetical protein